jgi:aryl-phospho-beta-D-glucosidase BglC (GH1 family)
MPTDPSISPPQVGLRSPAWCYFKPYFQLSQLSGDVKRAVVPGQVQYDLLQAGVITDPYREDNDVLQRWIAEDNWTYTLTFDSSLPTNQVW